MGNKNSINYEDTIDPLNIGNDYSIFTCKDSGALILKQPRVQGKSSNGIWDLKTCGIIILF